MSGTSPTISVIGQDAADVAKQGAATVLSAPPGSEPAWAKPAVSIGGLLVFAGAYLVTYLSHDAASLTLMNGAAIGIGSTVVNYWLGSSAGSARKTEIAAASAPPVA